MSQVKADEARVHADLAENSSRSTTALRDELQSQLAKAVQDAEAKAAADASDGDRKLSSELKTVQDDASQLKVEVAAGAGSTAALRDELRAELAKALQDAEAKAAADAAAAAESARKLSAELENVREDAARLQAETSASAGSMTDLREEMQELANGLQEAEAKASLEAATVASKHSAELQQVLIALASEEW